MHHAVGGECEHHQSRLEWPEWCEASLRSNTNTWYYSVEADQPPQLLAVPLGGEQVPAEPPLGVHAPGVREPVDAGAGDHDRAGDKDNVKTS